jgi:PRTRC genetic system protein C
MALLVKSAKREFRVKTKNKKDSIVLKDPHPEMTLEEVKHYYKSRYPEIATAMVEGPKMEENKSVYVFNTVMGDKG